MWVYKQPVKIYFGNGEIGSLRERIGELGCKRAVLVCDKFLQENGTADKITEESCGVIVGRFCDIQQNPTVVNVDECADFLRETKADLVVALGGGSAMDCAKAAASVAAGDKSVTVYHGTGVLLPPEHLPLIAVPTTAGTGTEVTGVSVLTDHSKGIKAPLLSDNFYPDIAVVDPELTYTVPPKVCVGTGLDVLAHAIEGYLSVNHQPICDALCISAAKLVFENIEAACKTPIDKAAKENMAAASCIAGLGFTIPKTGASHACSYVLTNKYGIPHGEACGLTLDYFTRINADAEGGRMHKFARGIGFSDTFDMCDEIARIKRVIGARIDLKDLQLSQEDIILLIEASKHPNMNNSPVKITDNMLREMYESFV